MGAEPELGATRTVEAALLVTGHADGVQHRQFASPVSDPDPAPDAVVWRAVSACWPGQAAAGHTSNVDRAIVRAAWDVTDQWSALRLRLVDAGNGRPPNVLR